MKDFKNKYRSQSNRLKEFDYTQNYWYYITTCTKMKIKYFGKVEKGKIKLNRYGNIAHKFWNELPNHFPVSIDYFVIMPNHMHGIIILENELNSNDRVVETQHCCVSTKSNNEPQFGKIVKGSLGVVIRSYKSAVTKQINLIRGVKGKSIWQSNYFEHIIRNDDDLYRIRDYIQKNPLKWEMDEYYRI